MDNNFEEFVQGEVLDFINEWEEKGSIPYSFWTKIGALGAIGVAATKKEGYLKKLSNIFDSMLLTNNIGFVASYAINEIALRLLTGVDKVFEGGNVGKKVRMGNARLSMCISEPNAGSDIGAIEVTANFDGKETYILNGKKIYVSNAEIADYYLIAARTDEKQKNTWRGISIFLVSREASGLSVVGSVQKAGCRLLPVGEVTLNNCEMPKSSLLGREGRGFMYLMDILRFERIVIAMIAVLIAERVIEYTLEFVKKRTVFGKKLSDLQHVRFTLGELYAQLEICKKFVQSVCDAYEKGNVTDTEVMISKLKSTELLKEISVKCPQFFGGAGYVSTNWISNIHNDSRWTCIGGGANELLKDLIGKKLCN